MQSPILDFAIGLIFVFLMTSLLCSTLQEMVGGWFKRRQRNLSKALDIMLGGQAADAGGAQNLAEAVKQHPLVKGLAKGKNEPSVAPAGMRGAMALMVGNGAPKPQLPSYLPAGTFVDAILDTMEASLHLAGTGRSSIVALIEEMPPGDVKREMQAMLRDVGDDAIAIRARLEDWYDDYMDRVSGWYKRWTQVFLFLWGLLVAVCFNIDTIEVGKALWRDPVLSSGVVEQVRELKGVEESTKEQILTHLEAAKLPIGPMVWELPSGSIPGHIPGWLLTALAASFGGPFWFNGLQQLMSLRNAGAKPPRADAQRSGRTATPSAAPAASASQFERSLTGDDIQDLQRALNMTGNAVTGRLDAPTRRAIADYQDGEGLPANGEVTPILLRMLLDE